MDSAELSSHQAPHPGSRAPLPGSQQSLGTQSLGVQSCDSSLSLTGSLGNQYDVTSPREDGLFQWRMREGLDQDSGYGDLKRRLLESLSQSVVESYRGPIIQAQPQQRDKALGRGSPRQLGRSRYLLLMIVSSMAFLGNGFAGGLGVLYVPILSEFNTTSAQAALVQSLADFTIFGGGLVSGMVVSRVGVGTSSILGSLIGTVGSLASAFAPNVPTLIGTASLITGAGLSLMMVVAWSLLAQLAHTLPRSSHVLLGLSLSLGLLSCPLIYSALLELYEWRGVYVFIAAFHLQTLPGSLFVYFILRNLKTETKKETQNWRQQLLATFHPDLLCNWRYLLYGILQVPLFTTAMLVTFFLPDLATRLGLSLQQGALCLTLYGAAMFVGRALQSVILGVWKVSTLVQSTFAIAGMAAVAPVFALASDFSSLLGVSIAYGIFFGSVGSASPQVAFEELSEHESFAIVVGFINFTVGLGDLLCGPFGGLIVDYTGSYDTAFYVTAATCATVCGLQVLLRCSCRGRQLPRYARLDVTDREADAEESSVLKKSADPGSAWQPQGKKKHYSTLQ